MLVQHRVTSKRSFVNAFILRSFFEDGLRMVLGLSQRQVLRITEATDTLPAKGSLKDNKITQFSHATEIWP